ncbi:MAG TPA: alpha/beta hydrolase [Candidatus Synoicihabitans sp.]|nr:alpha/beta hydrolase [Candidatus Synoicihabitans sp.]
MSDPIARNHVRILGRGRQPMLFAHGFGCDQTMWRFVAPAFQDRFNVVLFDYVGSGRSDAAAYRADRYSSLDGYASDVLEIIERADLREVVFVGHSVSSMIGVLAAARAPERFSQLILVVPSACYINDPPDYVGGFSREDVDGLLDLMEKNYLGWASFLAPLVIKNDDKPELQQELTESFCAADPGIAKGFAKVTFLSDNRTDLARVATPSYILQCTDDAVAPPSAIDYVRRHLRGSVLCSLQATGHCPHMTHPEETIEAMNAYLASVGLPHGD